MSVPVPTTPMTETTDKHASHRAALTLGSRVEWTSARLAKVHTGTVRDLVQELPPAPGDEIEVTR